MFKNQRIKVDRGLVFSNQNDSDQDDDRNNYQQSNQYDDQKNDQNSDEECKRKRVPAFKEGRREELDACSSSHRLAVKLFPPAPPRQ